MCSWHWFLLVCFPPDCFLMRLPLAANFSCLHRLQSFFRACLRPCDWLHLSCAFHRLHYSRACHRLHFFPRLSPRMRLITCFPRMSQLTFFPALATDCTWFPRLPQVTFFPPLSPLLRLIVQVSSACHGRLHFPRLPLPTFQTFCSVSQGVLCKPLLLAARGGHKDIVEFLLEKGASPTEEDTVKLKTRLINLFTVTINPLLIFP